MIFWSFTRRLNQLCHSGQMHGYIDIWTKFLLFNVHHFSFTLIPWTDMNTNPFYLYIPCTSHKYIQRRSMCHLWMFMWVFLSQNRLECQVTIHNWMYQSLMCKEKRQYQPGCEYTQSHICKCMSHQINIQLGWQVSENGCHCVANWFQLALHFTGTKRHSKSVPRVAVGGCSISTYTVFSSCLFYWAEIYSV